MVCPQQRLSVCCGADIPTERDVGYISLGQSAIGASVADHAGTRATLFEPMAPGRFECIGILLVSTLQIVRVQLRCDAHKSSAADGRRTE